MRSLVIGAGGFVGGHLVEHLCQKGDEVVATTIASMPVRAPVEVLSLDITDAVSVAEVMRKVQPDVVYHLAGIAFVPEAESNFERALTVNVSGTSHVARYCHLNSKASLLFISSAEVYGQVTPSELPVTEHNALRPANNYSLSKRMAELVVERYGRQGLNYAIARPFNHIGPGQDPRFVASNFALQLARVARGLTPPVLEVGNLEARRDFSDVRDIVRAYRMIATGHTGVFNLGSGRSCSIQEVLDTLIDISGCDVEIRQDPNRMRGPEVPELFGSIDRAADVCGWKPEIPLRRSLEDTYTFWYDSLGAESLAKQAKG
jgi:GDP-4-dehydro-6-deoxy-D-mannose reductase